MSFLCEEIKTSELDKLSEHSKIVISSQDVETMNKELYEKLSKNQQFINDLKEKVKKELTQEEKAVVDNKNEQIKSKKGEDSINLY